jgi:hypothetical protein
MRLCRGGKSIVNTDASPITAATTPEDIDLSVEIRIDAAPGRILKSLLTKTSRI